jgi:hypothetical protein
MTPFFYMQVAVYVAYLVMAFRSPRYTKGSAFGSSDCLKTAGMSLAFIPLQYAITNDTLGGLVFSGSIVAQLIAYTFSCSKA